MANYFHGVSTRQNDTSISTPVTADSGIAFVVGAAPGHTVDGAPNDPIMCQSYAEAVAALGYSDDWEKYPICEAIYSQFKLYGVAPVVFVNVLDPAKHKKSRRTELPRRRRKSSASPRSPEKHGQGDKLHSRNRL